MRNLISKFINSIISSLLLFVSIIVAFPIVQVLAQGVSDPEVPPGRIFVLQDIVDNFNFGLNAGGEVSGFGNRLGEFSIQEGEGIYSGAATSEDSADAAVILSTTPEGFGGIGQDFIGFSKTFAASTRIDPVTGESISENTIDARGFTAISYFVKNDGNNSDSNATVALELVMGDGSVWSQFPPKRIADVINDSSFNDFERIVVTLQGSVQGVLNGFIRTAAPTDGSTGSTLTDELLSQITGINIVLRDTGDTIGTRRAIFVDNIVFVSSEFNLAIQSFPFNEVPISGDFTGMTSFDIPNLEGNTQVSLCTPILIPQGTQQFAFDRWILDGIPQEGEVDAGTGLNCIDFKVIQNSTLITRYQPLSRTLTVRSTPVTGISISATPAGVTTDFDIDVDVGMEVVLEAPVSQEIAGQQYHFLRWEVNGTLQQEQQNIVTFIVEDDVEAVAIFESGDFTIAVTSVPVDGVTIGGTDGGITDYILVRGNGATIQLTAPLTHQISGVALDFKQWLVLKDGNVEPSNADPNLSISITTDTHAIAIFDLVWILNSGWTLISTPVELTEATHTDLFSKIDSPLWFWDGKKFQTADTVEVGKGYWVFSNEDEAPIVLDEASPQSGINDNAIELSLGWNLFGIKEFAVIPDPLTSSRFILPPDTNSAFWAWDSVEQNLFPVNSPLIQLFKQNTLFPGLGYWVYLTNAGQNE